MRQLASVQKQPIYYPLFSSTLHSPSHCASRPSPAAARRQLNEPPAAAERRFLQRRVKAALWRGGGWSLNYARPPAPGGRRGGLSHARSHRRDLWPSFVILFTESDAAYK